MQKRITIYDKNGNPMEIMPSVKSAYIGNGWFMKKPENKVKES